MARTLKFLRERVCVKTNEVSGGIEVLSEESETKKEGKQEHVYICVYKR